MKVNIAAIGISSTAIAPTIIPAYAIILASTIKAQANTNLLLVNFVSEQK